MLVADQIEKLETAFLDSVTTAFPSPLSEVERANLHAYLVLSHAILEEEIESAFEDYFDAVSLRLDSNMVPASGFLLAYAIGDQLSKEVNVSYKNRNTIEFVRNRGREVLMAAIRANNGLKGHNLERLAKVVGLDWGSFDGALGNAIADLNTFGGKRGSSSHLSPFSSKVTSISGELDPDDVKRWVDDAVVAAESIRNYLAFQVASAGQELHRSLNRRCISSSVRLRASRAILRSRIG